jgi:cytochrome P450
VCYYPDVPQKQALEIQCFNSHNSSWSRYADSEAIRYDGGAGEYRHLADTRVKAEHQAKRKMLAHFFAQKTIAGLEPVINATTAILVTQVDNTLIQASP